ncbi:NAD-dependent epimerase/dehydratase family protein [Streptomyces griseoincarnatus]
MKTTRSPLSALNGAKVLLTGGAGLIGTRVHRRLEEAGAIVTVLDDLSAYEESTLELLGVDQSDPQLIVGDVADQELVNSLVNGSDYVIHAAAHSTVAGCKADPETAFRSNMAGVNSILRAVVRAGSVKRFLFVSSAQVYGQGDGRQEVQRFTEDMPADPLNPYASAKLWGELQTRQMLDHHGIDYAVIRPFSVYGEGQVPKPDAYSWVIAQFTMYAALGQELPLLNDGRAVRDRIHVDDTAEAICHALVAENASRQTLNLGTGVATTVREAAELVREYFADATFTNHPPAPQDPLGGYADTTHMERALGWRPEISLADGVRRVVTWLRETPQAIPQWLRDEHPDRAAKWLSDGPR